METPVFLRSPRRRRRLGLLGLALVAVVAIAATLQLLPEGTKRPADTFSSEPADIYAPQPPVELDTPARRAIGETLERFVQAGLGREDLGAAYRLSTPDLRGGITLREWKRGELPVIPYRARKGGGRAWTKEYAFGDTVGVELFLHPAATETMGPIAFKATVRRLDGRWLVDSVVPAATFSRAGEKPRVFANTDLQRGTLGSGSERAKLSATWLLIPGGLLVLSTLVPLAIFGVRAARGK